MLRAIIRFCINERLIVLLLAVVVIAAGWHSTRVVPIDAIPDVGENQVIVFTDWPGRSPKDIEDQVTYPLSVAMLAVPGAESVRGKSMFGFSFVQVTFADHVDFYWTRSRVAEQLVAARGVLPEGVTPALGPDATALGQILYYTLEPPADPPGMNLAQLRSLQDFVVKYELQSVAGVSEVASVGGYVRQYQIEADPEKLRFHDIPLDRLVAAVRESNLDVGAKTVETGGMEFIIRGKGFLGSGGDADQAVADLEETVVLSREGVPVQVRDLGYVQLGPAFRRGAIDLNGTEAVGGVVVMQFGENPRHVIDRVKQKMAALEPSLNGATFNLVYDRTDLIDETIATLTHALQAEIIITIVVVLLFLLHLRASLVVAVTLPIAVLMSFVAMRVLGVDANIMSLAGIAIAVGEVIDLAIIVCENVYRHLTEWEAAGSPGGPQRRLNVILEGAHEVAPAVVTAITTAVISFLPVFFLTGRDYKLFAPLAWTKTFAMVSALLVAVLLVPLLARLFLSSARWSFGGRLAAGASFGLLLAATVFFVWGEHLPAVPYLNLPLAIGLAAALGFAAGYLMTGEKLRPIDENPVSRTINWVYEPALRLFLRHRFAFLCLPALVVVFGLGAWFGLPTVLKPVERFAEVLGADLHELPGWVEMTHLLPGLGTDDWIALDEGSWFYMPVLYPAASFSQAMEVLQTQDALIKQIPEVENVLGKIGRIESALDPAPAAMVETYVMLKPKSEWREGVTERTIWDQLNDLATLPGVTRASPLQPIEGRVVMLQAGIRAPMAIRIYGDDLEELATASRAVADHLRQLPQVSSATVNPDLVLGKPYVEFDVDRREAARFGMSATKVNQIVETALGGMNVTTTVEGRERYPVQVRYPRDLREQIDELNRMPVVTPTGEVVPLETLASMQTVWGPGEINSEDARLVAHVIFSPSGSLSALETASTVEQSIREAMSRSPGESGHIELPEGYFVQAVGTFQSQIETNRRLMIIIPLVIAVNLLLIYLHFRNLAISLAVFAGIPVAFGGGMILLALFDIEMNTAVWIGFIALFGIAIDDGILMGTYLNQVFRRRKLQSVADIRNATVEAGLKRIRPALMTTFTTFAALTPIILSTGRGADVARAMAVPVFGGMLFAMITVFVVPVVYCGYVELKMRTGMHDEYWEGTEQPPGEDSGPGHDSRDQKSDANARPSN